MGLTSALYTGLSGLNANQQRIDTIGDNISNVNTTAFKSSRTMFQTQFSQTLSAGTAPTATSGGTNPSQVGLGTLLASIQKDFSPGPIETTGVPTDLAIDGSGFFVVLTPDGSRYYTRDGTFKLNASNYLVSQTGAFVQGYGVDQNFNIVQGTVTNLSIPLGSLSTARPTSGVKMQGNLYAGGEAGTRGTVLFSQPLTTAGGGAATASTLLTDLRDPSVSTTDPLFAVGDTITLANVKRGDRNIGTATYTVTAASTLSDFLTFLTGKAAIDQSSGQVNHPGWWVADGSAPNPAAPTAGQDVRSVGVPPAGTIVIEGNIGAENRLSIGAAAITSSNPRHRDPFAFSVPNDSAGNPWQATGESAATSIIVYDSLGTEVKLDLTAVLEQKATTGNTWRFFASSKDDTDVSRVIGNGTITFGTDARVTNVTGNDIVIDRANTGAATPLRINLDFNQLSGFSNQEAVSKLLLSEQDGLPAGSLNGFSVDYDGKITGSFSNGLTRTLGQVVLATFPNPDGLVAEASNLFSPGPNSGVATITTPLTLGVGRILSGSLELSNVDLSREFIGLIAATTGFSAASRLISTSNDLLNQLLAAAR